MLHILKSGLAWGYDQSWENFLTKLASVPEYGNDRELSANLFWKKYLNKEGFITEPLRDIVLKSLALPTGSSSVERGFSVLGTVLNKSKPKIKMKRINSVMCLKLNGNPLQCFDRRYYSEEWVKKNVRADDPTCKKEDEGDPNEGLDEEEIVEENPNVMFGQSSFIK